MIVGIDPGATGAIAFLDDDGRLLEVHDMPYVDGRVIAPELAALFDTECKLYETAWVEHAQSMPGMSVSAMFKYGVGYGVILGVLGALHIPTQHIRPHIWKKAASLSKDKGVSRRRAIELWPEHSQSFMRVKDDGRAEAALIARHGWLAQRRAVPA